MKSMTVQVMFDAEHSPVLMVTSLSDDNGLQRREYSGFDNNRDRVEREFGDLVEQLILAEYKRLKK